MVKRFVQALISKINYEMPVPCLYGVVQPCRGSFFIFLDSRSIPVHMICTVSSGTGYKKLFACTKVQG